MDQSYINTVTDLAKALNLPVHTDINRLMKRCRFNRRGYLSRLYLNGLNLKGTIDISEYTKHLTALDSRNNPELRDIRISALSELGFLLSFDSEELYSDALKTDKGQTVYVIEPGHDSDESPFAKYFNSDESAPSAPSEPDSKNTASDTTRTVISDTSYDSVQADDHALAAGTEIEKALLRNAIIGRELTTCLQDNFDRTNIGMFNKGLIQVQKLATQLERIKSIKQLIRTVRRKLSPDATEDMIHTACRETADSIWSKPRNGIVLADLLTHSFDDLPVNAHNFGHDGVNTIKYARQKPLEAYSKIRNVVRDEYIAGAAYGESNLRLSIRKYTQLVEELKESIRIYS